MICVKQHSSYAYQYQSCVNGIGAFPTLKPRRDLGRVTFCKGVWDCYLKQEKKPNNDPLSLCDYYLGPVPFSFRKWRIV